MLFYLILRYLINVYVSRVCTISFHLHLQFSIERKLRLRFQENRFYWAGIKTRWYIVAGIIQSVFRFVRERFVKRALDRGVLFNGGNELIATTGSCACASDDLLLRRSIRYAARVHRGALKSQARKAAELLHNCASRRDNFWTLLIGQTHFFHANNTYSTTWNRNFQLAPLLNAFTLFYS